MITIRELIDWIMKHRGNKVFQGYDDISLALVLNQKINEGMLFYFIKPTGELVGIVIADKKPEQQTILVLEALAVEEGVLREMIAVKKRLFPEYQLEAVRHGKPIQYKTKQLTQKILGE